MSDTGFREIQLSGKHVVFLFMAGAVAAIAIFLLGVSVGRGVVKPEANPATSPAPVADTGGSQQLPPPTLPARGELQAQGILQGKSDPPTTTTPSPSPTATTGTDALATRPAATPEPAASPAAKPAAAPKTSAAAPIYLQVNSFKDRSNATREMSKLESKGFHATIVPAPGGGAPYKVRMGPYDEEEAATMMARLRKEGYTPSRTR